VRDARCVNGITEQTDRRCVTPARVAGIVLSKENKPQPARKIEGHRRRKSIQGESSRKGSERSETASRRAINKNRTKRLRWIQGEIGPGAAPARDWGERRK